MEENQNQQDHADDPVKSEESDSIPVTTDNQVSVHNVMIKPSS